HGPASCHGASQRSAERRGHVREVDRLGGGEVPGGPAAVEQPGQGAAEPVRGKRDDGGHQVRLADPPCAAPAVGCSARRVRASSGWGEGVRQAAGSPASHGEVVRSSRSPTGSSSTTVARSTTATSVQALPRSGVRSVTYAVRTTLYSSSDTSTPAGRSHAPWLTSSVIVRPS